MFGRQISKHEQQNQTSGRNREQKIRGTRVKDLIEPTKIGLNLHFDLQSLQLFGFDQNEKDKKEEDWDSPHRKISRVLNTMAAVVEAGFPSLTPHQWNMVLEATMPSRHRGQDFSNNSFGELLNSLYQEYGALDPDFTAIAELEPSAILPITLVANSFFQDRVVAKPLRDVLSEVSGRPHEAVFSNDPSMDDLWSVRDIEIDGNDIIAHLDYSGGETAKCFVARTSPESLALKRVECATNRVLVPPTVRSSENYLFGLALPRIFEKLDEQESGSSHAA